MTSGRDYCILQFEERAFEFPKDDQPRFVHFLFVEPGSERQWAELVACQESEELLGRLADEALSEHNVGRTQPLNADDL